MAMAVGMLIPEYSVNILFCHEHLDRFQSGRCRPRCASFQSRVSEAIRSSHWDTDEYLG